MAAKNPRRPVERGLLIPARVPQPARDGGPDTAPWQAWEGT